MGLFSSVTTAHYRAVALLWTLALVGAFMIPAESLSTVEPALSYDKLAHIVLFAGFGGLWMRALCPPSTTDAETLRRCALGVLVVGVGFAVSTEWLQHIAPIRRMADPYDVGADLVGLFVAVGAYGYHVRRTAVTPSAQSET